MISRSLRSWHYARAGYSLARCKQLDFAEEFHFSGKVLDLGSRSDREKHLANIDKSKISELVLTDLNPASDAVSGMDLGKTWHYADNQFDFVSAMNLLEHMEDVSFVLGESRRVLREGGTLLGVVPFLFPVHMDPDDFWRFTPSSLRMLLREAGFRDVTIHRLGVGHRQARAQMSVRFQYFASVKYFSWMRAQFEDYLIAKFAPVSARRNNENFFLALGFSAKK